MSLHRLVYTSYRKASCSDDEIEQILSSCKRNNPGSKITGVLLHSDNRFIQYLEGEKPSIEKLYETIEEDNRHESVVLRCFEPVSDRIFGSWEMGYKDITASGLDYYTNIEEGDKTKFVKLMNGELDFANDGIRLLQLFFNY